MLDWELSTIGHPLVDFAYHVMRWRLTEELTGMRDMDLEAMRIPSEADYVASYCRRTGRNSIANWDYYVVFNFFRLAAIDQGIVARALAGTASSTEAMETGMKGRAIAETGWREAQERMGA